MRTSRPYTGPALALTSLALVTLTLMTQGAESASLGGVASDSGSTAGDYGGEKERLKEEITRELADYLYFHMMRGSLAGSAAGTGTGSAKTYLPNLAGYGGGGGPGSSSSSSSSYDYGQFGSGVESNPDLKLYMKKSLKDNKQQQITYHQCYFNPISCFRR